MHKEILSESQVKLLPLIKKFKKNFYLVGGTAIALHIGHRRSIDFDLFTNAESLDLKKIKSVYKAIHSAPKRILYEAFDQFHINIDDVKITFFSYPYPITAKIDFASVCRIPNLLELGAMKVFALGGRANPPSYKQTKELRRTGWKDYVDLYFILKSHHSLRQICRKAEHLYDDLFSSKLLRQQLSYFDDIDYSEEVELMSSEVTKEEVKNFLIDTATEEF